MSSKIYIEKNLQLDGKNILFNPDNESFKQILKKYYIKTKDNQYLFASTQPGRRPDRAFYMVPEGYKLGKKQQRFDNKIGKKIFDVAFDYLKEVKVILQEGIQGEHGYEAGLRVIYSIENPHTAYIAWMGKLMVFPSKKIIQPQCFNYIIPEGLPKKYVEEIKKVWLNYEPDEPITLYDLTEMDKDIRRVISICIDYFGGAFKKPNLTMVWNRVETNGMVSYHAGCTKDRVLKGLSGTGKTTLTVGTELEQDDALAGKPYYDSKNKIKKVQLIGLEAASFAKSQDLIKDSPEWPGLMKSKEIDENGNHPIVLAMNIDCKGVEYIFKEINGYKVKIPRKIKGQEIGSLECTKYEKSKTTNGRFIFQFSVLNEYWGKTKEKYLKTESLSFKRFDVLEPIFRVVDPIMAVALDSGCESIITSAVSAQKSGTRVRSYSATDFMAREQSQQALMKLKMYKDLGLGRDGKLVFFINNAGYVGEYDLMGEQIKKSDENGNQIAKLNIDGKAKKNEVGKIIFEGHGEKIKVQDSKKLINLIENRKINKWIKNPIYGYLIPDPKELEEVHGMKDFGKRFNLLRFYTSKQIIEFTKRDIDERTKFLKDLFSSQEGEEELKEVMNVWNNFQIPSEKDIEEFYLEYYGDI